MSFWRTLVNFCILIGHGFQTEDMNCFLKEMQWKASLLWWFCLFAIKLMAIFLIHSRVKFLLHVSFHLRDVTAEISFRLCCQKISSPIWEKKLPNFQNVSTQQGHFGHGVSVKTSGVSKILFIFWMHKL